METISIGDMMGMQRALQEKYKEKWRATSPENAYYALLWAIGEAGEIIDILKKQGHERVMDVSATRAHFMEETVDVMMYLWDMLLCVNVTPEEFSDLYARKHAFNMVRTFGAEHFQKEDGHA